MEAYLRLAFGHCQTATMELATPIPGDGSEAMIKGAPLVFFVGESLISQWTLTTTPDSKRVGDLKGKTLGLGRPGSADYSEIVITLGKHFNMRPGKDYKVIAFTGEADRIAALIQGVREQKVSGYPIPLWKRGIKGDLIVGWEGFFVHRAVRRNNRSRVRAKNLPSPLPSTSLRACFFKEG